MRCYEIPATDISIQDGSIFLGNIIHVQKREIHKKHPRGAFTSQLANKTEEPSYISGFDSNMDVPSFSFSLKDVADLAARLSVQILSDAGIPASPHPLGFSVSYKTTSPVNCLHELRYSSAVHSFQQNQHQPAVPAF
jgi:hypothetical protein